MAFPTIASITETSSASGSSTHAVSMPATVEENDLLVMYFVRRGSGGITTPADWTQKWTDATVHNSSVFVIKPTSTQASNLAGSTVTVTVGGTPAAAAQVYRIAAANWFRDLAGVETGSVATGTSDSPNPPSYTVSWGALDNLWVASFGGADDDATVSDYPTNYTDGVDTVSGGGMNSGSEIGTARRELAAATDDPGVFTISESESWHANTMVIRPSTGIVILRRRREFVGVH